MIASRPRYSAVNQEQDTADVYFFAVLIRLRAAPPILILPLSVIAGLAVAGLLDVCVLIAVLRKCAEPVPGTRNYPENAARHRDSRVFCA